MDWLNSLLADHPDDGNIARRRRIIVMARWPAGLQAEAQANAAVGSTTMRDRMASEISAIDDLLLPKSEAKRKQRELSALNEVFGADMRALRDYWMNALIANDEEMKAQILQEMADAAAQFATDRAAISAKYTNT